MHQMQDGFSKVYMQLEALDERLQDVQAIGDKVDMLETSVRLLENHAFLWPMVNYGVDPDGQSSVSSSSLHSMSTPAITTVTPAGAPATSIKQRSLPKRNHTISSIKYDSSAYKVSFNLGGDVEDAFHDHEGQEVMNDGNIGWSLPGTPPLNRSKRKIRISSQSDDTVQEEDGFESDQPNALGPSIARSKSFSNDVDWPKAGDEIVEEEKQNKEKLEKGLLKDCRGRRSAGNANKLMIPTSRTQSLRLSEPKSPRSTRFSWTKEKQINNQDMPEGTKGPLHSPSSLKDSKYRGSMTSLASDVGSGSTTPNIPYWSSSSSKGHTSNTGPSHSSLVVAGTVFDISAKELMQRPSVHHSGNLEMKKTSGTFKSYKRYWAVLDSNFLYLYGRERDSKAKQVIDVTGCTLTELMTVDAAEKLASASSSASNSGTSSSSGSFRESLKKRGGRSFELVFNTGESRYFAAATKEEAEEWMRKLRHASTVKRAPVAGGGGAGADHHLQTSSDMHILALEQEFEDEVLHQCSSESNSGGLTRLVHQEWRIKHQSSDASCR